ncbi:MAG: hypothetical protein M9894_09600 [Planctomycetes bacterium]|nr:hypothetical protein [Planctomycetota bacterium]
MSETVVQHELSPRALAGWLRRQPATWWSVDGDPLLMGSLNLPCSAEDLAAAIEASGRSLVLHVFGGVDTTGPDEDVLTRVAAAGEDTAGNRSMTLAWADSDSSWLLIEDRDVAEFAAQSVE